MSPIFFSVYVDKLIKKLRKMAIGCTIAGVYLGIVVYADDIFLLSPSREGLQTMMNFCQKFAASRNLTFSTNVDIKKSKTKCIVFSRRKVQTENIVPIYLNNTPLPYVDKLLHLGNMIQSDNSMKNDISIKRARFIGKANSLNQEFYYSSPEVRCKLLELYCCSYYSSSIWNLYNRDCDKLYKSFNVAIRICYNIPRNTHRFFIEELVNFPHPKIMLCSRFVKFYDTLIKSKKGSVRLLAKLSFIDEKTVLKSNLRNIAKDCHTKTLDELSPSTVKNNMRYFEVPENEEWRVSLLHNLLLVRSKQWTVDQLEDRKLEHMIYEVCTT